ncbi:hypothetical protein SAMN04487948_12643 [Halogranum amylolyticum]|uniref:Phage integrase family protein n=1 Tax=Halogranum amylolyticum TaxID=660520 RepID=A0A1H8WB99_9EURY|nr:site-specific integrase [Halogranum amylolyticum]SEP24942.1 hypothetical protein SAMN04487948_12643 [Halogranum amylolyticum]
MTSSETGDGTPEPPESDAGNVRARELKDAIDRYIRYKSTDGKGESGYYVNSAKPVLMQFYNWCRDTGHADLSRLGDETEGPDVMRKYAKRLSQRESVDAITAGTARTYWNIISGFMTDARDDGDLSINPCLRKRAKDPLPTDTDDSKQQFWDDVARGQILRHVDQEAHAAIDEHGMDAGTPVRDRALVYLLAYTGVRGAEVLRASKDDRDGRQGLRWKHVDLEGGKIRVFRKTQRWEWTPLPT